LLGGHDRQRVFRQRCLGLVDPLVVDLDPSRRLDILPVEVVVRDYLAGTTATSVWSMYKAGHREIYGLRFPDGLRETFRRAGAALESSDLD